MKRHDQIDQEILLLFHSYLKDKNLLETAHWFLYRGLTDFEFGERKFSYF